MIKPIQFTSNSPFTAFDTNKTNIKAPEPTVLNKTPEDSVELDNNTKVADEATNNITKENNEQTTQQPDVQKTETQEKKWSFNKIKEKALNIIKGFNTTTNTTIGVVKGATYGGLTIGAVGIIAKNIKKAPNKNVTQIIKGSAVDAAKVAKKTICFIPNLITKSPWENIKSLASLPSKFYGTYLKGCKGAAAIATVAGLGVLGFNSIKGKMKANMKNANVDHATNQTHKK